MPLGPKGAAGSRRHPFLKVKRNSTTSLQVPPWPSSSGFRVIVVGCRRKRQGRKKHRNQFILGLVILCSWGNWRSLGVLLVEWDMVGRKAPSWCRNLLEVVYVGWVLRSNWCLCVVRWKRQSDDPSTLALILNQQQIVCLGNQEQALENDTQDTYTIPSRLALQMGVEP